MAVSPTRTRYQLDRDWIVEHPDVNDDLTVLGVWMRLILPPIQPWR
jgi:hypothetical protein